MNAYVAWTPLHIINILNTQDTYFKERQADLYIYNEFQGANELYDRMQSCNLFEHVYLIKYTDMGSTIQRKVNLVINKNIMHKEEIPKYTEFFIQGENYFTKILFGQAKKKNPDLKLNYIEDGIGAYLDVPVFSSAKNKRKVFNVINSFSIFKESIKNYYLYEPELSFFPKKQIKKLPSIEKNSNVYFWIQQIFSLEEPSVLKNKLIYIDQPLEKDGFSFNEYDLLQRVQQANTESKEILVKLHPRSEPKKYGNSVDYLETTLPFELFMLHVSFEDSVIISPLSTLSFSASMIFGLETKTLLLAKYISENNGFMITDKSKVVIDEFNRFYERYRQFSSKNMIDAPIDDQALIRDLK